MLTVEAPPLTPSLVSTKPETIKVPFPPIAPTSKLLPDIFTVPLLMVVAAGVIGDSYRVRIPGPSSVTAPLPLIMPE